MELATERLMLEPIGELTDPEEVLSVVNSNPDWVASSDDFAGKSSWHRSDAEMHLWKESVRENSVSFGIRRSEDGELVGLGGFLEPHPDRGVPMVGLLLVHRKWQRRGIGSETVMAIEEHLAERGWAWILVTVLEACPSIREFWERSGFEINERTRDQDTRPVWVPGKHL